jgi:hypothetical protein
MDSDSLAIEQLSHGDCMRLIGSVPVGRIVYTQQALPAVELVNFALIDGDIVIKTSAEGKLAAATRGAVVAFKADSVDLGPPRPSRRRGRRRDPPFQPGSRLRGCGLGRAQPQLAAEFRGAVGEVA